ncbi:MAG: hypothetical protein P0Y59_01460 [Candidatus Sphingomonas phytovorans]|nr:hypothetical protein [Sphingomonas sp.]WEK00392.1 MAG: hypothetical protein P0Y59_01460 [Sphingomonas sp.]
MSHLHLAHGLVLSLPFACDELAAASPGAIPDVMICEGHVPPALDDARLRDATHEASPNAYLMRAGPGAGQFLAERGNRILFQRGPQCDEALFRHVLLNPMLAALLRQRDLLVLHASGVVSPDGVVLICGDSGAGKSTTAAAMTRLGWPLHTDDVSALSLDRTEIIEVPAGARHVHLFEEASDALALDSRGLARNAWHRMKMAVPAFVEPVRPPRRLRRIVHLERGLVAAVRIERVTGRAKLPLLMHSVYGPYLVEAIAARAMLVSRALQSVEMLRITRPDTDWTMDRVLAAIMAD